MAETTYPTRSRRGEHDADEPVGVEEHHDHHDHDDHEHELDRALVLTGGPGSMAAMRDGVRWGPIWAGLITAVTTFLILTTGALAIGLQVIDPTSGVEDAGMTSAIVSAVIALVAFFVGGFVAGWALGGLGRGYGALNGFLVWGLGIAILLVLTAFGLGSIFGASGELLGQFQQLQSFRLQGVEASALIDAMRTTALGALLGMILPAVAAAGGGLLGALAAPEPVEA